MTALVGTPGQEATPTDRLAAHLTTWLGAWPPGGPLTVVESPARTEPGWDGQVHGAVGVATPDGAVLSVPPGAGARVREVAGAWTGLPGVLAAALDRPGTPIWLGTLRWTARPADLPGVGVWLAADDPVLPPWLRPFGGQVLVALDGGEYAAGVGLKRHDGYGVELAVGTDPGHRGRGLAARLVAQAARHILAAGAVPTYIHDPANTASARTAAAAGFPDEGWQALGMPPAKRR
ncbi:MAG TPA: GNAT family N-acetyltransferase [Rugosimonospora sp.]|nr:GNAT family N-acetyltransferase [Rugosimonospora sp.]